MIEMLVPEASTYAHEIDFLVNLVGVIVGFWFLLSLGVFFFLIWRYRYQEGVPTQYVDGSDPKHKRFISWPHNLILLCDIVLAVFAVKAWVLVKQTLPEPTQGKAEEVRVVAQQWAWTFVYPGPDGKFDTTDDIKVVDDMHVAKGVITHFDLVSRDVLHSFSIPVFRLKQDVIPGRVIKGWFEATETGTFDLQCTEICGLAHGLMFGKVVVETPEQHAIWLAAHVPAGVPTTPAAATPAPPSPAPAPPPTPEKAPTPEKKP
ncbi:MAG TPA: cytochrome C oxidase subunit II [Myxococcota bacterium]